MDGLRWDAATEGRTGCEEGEAEGRGENEGEGINGAGGDGGCSEPGGSYGMEARGFKGGGFGIDGALLPDVEAFDEEEENEGSGGDDAGGDGDFGPGGEIEGRAGGQVGEAADVDAVENDAGDAEKCGGELAGVGGAHAREREKKGGDGDESNFEPEEESVPTGGCEIVGIAANDEVGEAEDEIAGEKIAGDTTQGGEGIGFRFAAVEVRRAVALENDHHETEGDGGS